MKFWIKWKSIVPLMKVSFVGHFDHLLFRLPSFFSYLHSVCCISILFSSHCYMVFAALPHLLPSSLENSRRPCKASFFISQRIRVRFGNHTRSISGSKAHFPILPLSLNGVSSFSSYSDARISWERLFVSVCFCLSSVSSSSSSSHPGSILMEFVLAEACGKSLFLIFFSLLHIPWFCFYFLLFFERQVCFRFSLFSFFFLSLSLWLFLSSSFSFRIVS